MIKSNTKKAIENIRNYIIRNADFSGYEEFNGKQPETFAETAKAIIHIYYEEKGHFNHRQSWQESFIDWLQGLPSAFDSLYYYNRSAIDDLGNILEETEAERNKYTEAEAERMLSCLIFREIYKACDYTIK